jgi:hypothetical protein
MKVTQQKAECERLRHVHFNRSMNCWTLPQIRIWQTGHIEVGFARTAAENPVRSSFDARTVGQEPAWEWTAILDAPADRAALESVLGVDLGWWDAYDREPCARRTERDPRQVIAVIRAHYRNAIVSEAISSGESRLSFSDIVPANPADAN